ncbi:conserved hypothetical protein [Paecilomyces variotii No. 5]|uniref:Uncharacterized protein n=1 Tax=Byssochlamys spectabilis (strain No. 5 / NBRC 109023) TaxID=1356009 RepID=V5HW14_BYSSN|nr:conserved hypothetical protein [Paecilomyces variotii No. 5]
MERGSDDKEHIVRIDETHEPSRASFPPPIRSTGSIVVSLDSGADVARKSFESRNQTTKSNSLLPGVLDKETLGELDNWPKEQEGHHGLEDVFSHETPTQSTLGACKTQRLTNDIERAAVEPFKEYPEAIDQANESLIQGDQQHSETSHKEESEKDTSSGADASPCDSTSSSDPLRTERIHPRLPETVPFEQVIIGITSRGEGTVTGVIPDSQERVPIMDTNTAQRRNSPSENISANETIKTMHVLKPIPRGRLKELFERKARATDSMDWDEDLRVPESEVEHHSSKKAKRSPTHLPSPSGSKKRSSVFSRKNKAQPKTTLPTPKTGTASSKKSRTSERAPVQNTLASCRPRRAAADEAKVKLLRDYNPNENTDDDPIEDSTPDDNPAFGDNFQFDQLKISTPQVAHSGNPKNEETETPVIDLTTASDGVDNVHEEEISAQSVADSPATNNSRSSPVENEDRSISSRVEENPKEKQTGRGHLIGSKLAAVLGEYGILSSSRVSEERMNAESQQPHTSPANVEYDQPLKMNDKLTNISNQVSEFINHKHDGASDGIDDTLGLSEPSETSEGYELVHSKAMDHVIQKTTEAQKQVGRGAFITKNAKPLTSSEGISTDSQKKSSRPIRLGASTATRTIGHPYSALIDEHLHRKAHIVSFSADGSRNQCEIQPSSVQKMKSLRPQSCEEREIQPKRKIFTGTLDNHTRPAKRLRFDFESSSDMDEDMASSSLAATGHAHTISSPSSQRNNLFRRSMVDENGSPNPGHRTMTQNITSRKDILHGSNVEGQTVARLDIPSAATTESSPVSYASRDTEVEHSPHMEQQFVKIYQPKAEAVLPSSTTSNAGRKRLDNVEMDGWGRKRQPNPLFVSQKQLPDQTMESHLPGEQEVGHVQKEQVDKEQGAQFSTFWDSISSLTKMGARKDAISESNAQAGYSRGSTIESSSPSLRSETSESITLVEPETQEARWDQLLRASHRSTLDILVDTSKRLVRHLVDEEDAVWDVVAMYDNGCRRLIDQLTEAHKESLEVYGRQMTAIRTEYKEIREKTLERLKASDKVLKALPTVDKLASGMRKREKLLARLQDLSTAYDAKLSALEATE